jgi:hypothetical protein
MLNETLEKDVRAPCQWNWLFALRLKQPDAIKCGNGQISKMPICVGNSYELKENLFKQAFCLTLILTIYREFFLA